MVPSLQLQCLYSVAGRLEEYSTQTLSLLPTSLRRQLLTCLPIVDICPLERHANFMNGIDPNEVWSKIKIGEVIKKGCFYVPNIFGGCETMRDVLLSRIANIFLRVCQDGRMVSLAYVLYGVAVSRDMYTFTLASYRDEALDLGIDLRWAVPQRYVSEVDSASLSQLWSKFFNSCQWFPTKCTCDYFTQSKFFQQLLPQVEEIYLDFTESKRRLSLKTPAAMSSALLTAVNATKMNTLNSVTLKTNYGDYLGWLITQLYRELVADGPDKACDCLKKLKLIATEAPSEDSDDSGNRWMGSPIDIENMVQLISNQRGLETLIISNIDFGSLFGIVFNYLPYFISRPCFRELHVGSSKVPCNSVENIITAFLNTPTTHDQHLEFHACNVIEKSFMTLSSECQLKESVELDLYHVAEKRCISGEHKSLSVPVGEPLLPLHWLGDYPGLRLQRLDLQVVVPRDTKGQVAKFSATCEALALFGICTDTLCVTTVIGHHQDCHESICELLKSPYLVELKFVFVDDFDDCFYYDTHGDNILSVMSSSLQTAKALQTVAFIHMETYFRPFFNSLFSLPSQQLANLALNFSYDSDIKYNKSCIIGAWKENANGQKVRSIKCKFEYLFEFQDMAMELTQTDLK